jgi:transaldolase
LSRPNCVADLADTLHWGNGAPPVKSAAPPALTPAKTKPKDVRKRSRAGRAVIQQRRDNVLAYLDANGPSTAIDVADSMFSDLPDRIGKARKLLDQLTDRGLVVRIPSDKHGTPMRFKAVDPNVAP